jgi:peptidoglycan hydrolase CwlO-like protein
MQATLGFTGVVYSISSELIKGHFPRRSSARKCQHTQNIILPMDNPTIQTDLAQVLSKLDAKIDKLDEKFDQQFDKLEERLSKLEIGQTEIKGEIKALDVKTEQLNTRVGSIEFAVRGVLVGLAVVVFGGFAMLFWMSNKL